MTGPTVSEQKLKILGIMIQVMEEMEGQRSRSLVMKLSLEENGEQLILYDWRKRYKSGYNYNSAVFLFLFIM